MLTTGFLRHAVSMISLWAAQAREVWLVRKPVQMNGILWDSHGFSSFDESSFASVEDGRDLDMRSRSQKDAKRGAKGSRTCALKRGFQVTRAFHGYWGAISSKCYGHPLCESTSQIGFAGVQAP